MPTVADVPDPVLLAERVSAGDRRALARSITLVESTRADHREAAAALLDAILPRTGDATRVGISGSPGVGKSTFIEAFGLHLVDEGHRLAVLAVDPTSRRSGGSILGDKTRMTELVRRPEAFVRPSPAGRTLGGVARRTREAMLLCEAAGFDVVLVETVGVGQSETAVADLVDEFVLLVSPGGGDDLQGIKRGIVELADLVVVNKADGDLLPAANRTAADYRNALGFLRPRPDGAHTEVLAVSALAGTGLAEVWDALVRYRRTLVSSGALDTRRRHQAREWFWSEVRAELLDQLRDDDDLARLTARAERDVSAGVRSPTSAARTVLGALAERRR